MNKYLIINKVLTTFGSLCSTILYIFCLYVLFSPSTVHLFIIMFIIGIICISINVGAKISSKKKKEQDYVSFIEHRYARTYRARYHNKLYVCTITSLFIISLLLTVLVAKDQFNKSLNNRFIESIEGMYDDSDIITVINKVNILIPNAVKEPVIMILDCIEEINRVVIELEEMKEDTSISEECISKHMSDRVREFENKYNNIEELVQTAQVQVLLLALALSILRITYIEVISWTEHYSIELK